MSNNPNDFKAAFAKQIRNIQLKLDAIPGKVVLELLGSLVEKSPVDTGRFKANWSVSDIKPGLVIPAPWEGIGAFKSFKPGNSIWITNNMPYARKLEYGSSKQAPNGMVRITVMDAPDFIKKAIRAMD